MGRVECQYHGVTGMIFTCAHIIQNQRDKKKTENIIRVDFLDTSNIEEKNIWHKQLFYCPRCVVEHSFPLENSEMSSDEFSLMYDKDFNPACWECFTELNS